MKTDRISNIIISIAVAALALTVVFFAVALQTGFFHNWSEGQYFGRVTETHDGGFTVADRGGRLLPVLIQKDTKIMTGRRSVPANALHAGDNIIVAGSPSGTGKIEARVVRIFPAPKIK